MNVTRISWMLGAMLVAACHGPAGDQAETPSSPMAAEAPADVADEAAASAPSGPILLSVRGTTMSAENKMRRPLEVDDELESGDFFAYHLRVDRDAFVYVLQFYPDGSAEVLFPAKGTERVLAGRDTRLPTDPQAWFQLDEATGTEHLYVIASREPLEATEPALAKLIGTVRSSPKLGAEPGAVASADPPPVAMASTAPPSSPARARRGTASRPDASRTSPLVRHVPRFRDRAAVLVRVEEDGMVEYQGRAPDEGVGIVHFPFEHR
jgi:Domain of unknown function (DUF4384)